MAVQLRPDYRRRGEGFGLADHCQKCGVRIIPLPDDRRQGYCFECYDGLELKAPSLRGD